MRMETGIGAGGDGGDDFSFSICIDDSERALALLFSPFYLMNELE